MDDAWTRELVRRSALLNDRDPRAGRDVRDVKDKYPLAARGCPACKGKGFYTNVVVKNESPYLVAIPCSCMGGSKEDRA